MAGGSQVNGRPKLRAWSEQWAAQVAGDRACVRVHVCACVCLSYGNTSLSPSRPPCLLCLDLCCQPCCRDPGTWCSLFLCLYLTSLRLTALERPRCPPTALLSGSDPSFMLLKP